jgi:hypothetical protein
MRTRTHIAGLVDALECWSSRGKRPSAFGFISLRKRMNLAHLCAAVGYVSAHFKETKLIFCGNLLKNRSMYLLASSTTPFESTLFAMVTS